MTTFGKAFAPVLSALAFGGCVSADADRRAELEAICAGADPDETTIIYQDRSTSYAGAAGAGVTPGTAEGAGAVVGQGVIGVATSRGGAVGGRAHRTDVETIACEPGTQNADEKGDR